MNIFGKILSIITNNNSNNKYDNFLFTIHFNESVLSQNEITCENFINYKYFILKNFLEAPSIVAGMSDQVLTLFNKVQKVYLALNKFKQNVVFKTRKEIDEHVDMQFNNIALLDEKYIITLVDGNIKYKFYIFDLIKIINHVAVV